MTSQLKGVASSHNFGAARLISFAPLPPPLFYLFVLFCSPFPGGVLSQESVKGCQLGRQVREELPVIRKEAFNSVTFVGVGAASMASILSDRVDSVS